MRFGYWLPVFGGWLRNVDDERMEPTWAYVKNLARRSESPTVSSAVRGLLFFSLR